MSRLKLEQVLFTLFIGLIFLGAFFLARQFPDTAQRFPNAILLTGLGFTVLHLLRVLLSKSAYPTGITDKGIANQFSKIAPYIIWIIGYYVLIFLFGLVIASAIFVIAFLMRHADMAWYYSILSAVIVVTLMLFIGKLLSLKWPFGLLGNFLDWKFFGMQIL